MVYGRFSALGCGVLEPLAVFRAEDDRGAGAGGGTPSDSKLSISSIAFCISESCSRRSGASLSYGIRSGRGHLLVSFSSRDGNRNEWMFVWELVEAEGSLRRGRGIKSWLNSFDRGSAERDEDGR